MSLVHIENLLGNLSFLTLFLSMLTYWFRAAFFIDSKQTSRWMNQLGFLGILGSNSCLTGVLTCRWINSHHFPLSNLYESLIFLAWALTLIHLTLEKYFPTNENIIGILFSPLPLLVSAFATFSLPEQMQTMAPLIPALKSNWLMMHVSIMMLSYAALLAGSLLSIVFLMVAQFQKEPISIENQRGNSLTYMLDQLSYRTLGVGFPLLTLGILSGAVWANEAWGSYWSWDPKETWALITWCIFAIYLHFRITYGWKGKKPAIIASLGFVFVWICYLGVNLFGSGLHSYGWLSR
jgi:cytochrome c-type biogenesis protein CcsB